MSAATGTDTAAGLVRPARRPALPYAARRRLFLLALAAPALAYVAAVALWPLTQGLWLSLTNTSLLHPTRRAFVGLDNYRALLADRETRAAFVNTGLFTLCAVAVEFVAGLGLALLLWRDSRFNRVALALVLVPVALTPIVVGLVFRALLAPDYGLIGYWLATWGLSTPRGLLGTPSTALATLVAVDAWQWTPLMALILLAGLKALPSDVLEAARADGATPAQRFGLVVLPLLLPQVFIALVLRMMDAFRVFDIVYVATAGGPADATTTLMLLAEKKGLEFFDIGSASAVANAMIACIGVVAGLFALLIRRADRAANEG